MESMSEADAIRKATAIASGVTENLRKLGGVLWEYLALSLDDDRIAPKKSICVSLEGADACVTYGSRFLSRITIRGAKRHSFSGHDYVQPQDLASSAALTASDLFATKAGITLSIPKAWAIIRTIELPSTVKENLPEVISYEMDRLTPFSAEDAYYDFQVLGEAEGKIVILIAAARSEIITPYLEAFGEKGLSVDAITVSLSGIGSLIHHREKGDFVFVDVRQDVYEGALYRNGIIQETFTGNYAAAGEKEKAEKIMADLDVVRSRGKQGKEPRIVLLLTDQSPTLKELLKARAQVPLTVLNETDTGLKLPGPRQDFSYASLGGVVEALTPGRTGLNLLDKGRHEKKKPPLGLTAVLVTLLIFLWILQIVTPFRTEEKRLAEIDRQISLKKDEVKKVEALKKEIDALNKDIETIIGFKEDRPMVLNVIRELTSVLPKTTWLTRVRVTETTAEIEGYASSATELLPKLEASKLFRKSEFASPTFRDARMNADRFVIKMEIKGFKKPSTEPLKAGEGAAKAGEVPKPAEKAKDGKK
ncbi:MAG TPA: PilN domain-containing protein [Thermodesulfovibrionales bacterium]|nr:PilN domain-containing protein [Thermodesulfovibrionales bacterium]